MDLNYLRQPLDRLPDPLPIPPLSAARAGVAPFEAHVRPPGSKSLTNRALLLAALARSVSLLHNPLLDADDARVMVAALEKLGAKVTKTAGGVRVEGVDGRWRVPPEGVELNLHNAGTATRFLAAAALLATGPVTIDGNARMRQRPIGELADLLRKLGATVEFLAADGCPPLRITPPHDRAGPARPIDVPTTQSSQFISALLLIAPWLKSGLTLRLSGEITSQSYVEMTTSLMLQVGLHVRTTDDLSVVRVAATPSLPGFELAVEPDASGATYFWTAAAITPGAACRVLGLGERSLQGDARFPELLARMGATVSTSGSEWTQCRGPAKLTPIIADLSDMPDTAMTAAAAAVFADGTTVMHGLRTLRVKETDRIAALVNELTKLGVEIISPVGTDAHALSITPPQGGLDCSPDAPRVEFDTYDDHRMAMSLALIGLRRPNVFIRDPKCVAKTYPTYWADLAAIYESGAEDANAPRRSRSE